MNEPCVYCLATALMSVRIPGHEEVEAVVCLACGQVQPVRATRAVQK